jgi:cell division protein FtsB
VRQLLEIIDQQARLIEQMAAQIQQFKDEIARLKNQPPQPKIQPVACRAFRSLLFHLASSRRAFPAGSVFTAAEDFL